MFIILGMGVLFILLLINLLVMLVRLIRHRFQNKTENWQFVVLLSFQAVIFFFPDGLVNFRDFEPENLISAQREGVANCMTYLNFRVDGTCVERQQCFGVQVREGTYQFKNDTLQMVFEASRTEPAGRAIGIVKPDSSQWSFLYYRWPGDTLPMGMELTKYALASK